MKKWILDATVNILTGLLNAEPYSAVIVTLFRRGDELLKELQEKVSPVVRKLIPPSQTFPRPAPMSEAEFRWEHNQDAMAVEKLSEGIRLFAVDQRKLEDLLAAKL